MVSLSYDTAGDLLVVLLH